MEILRKLDKKAEKPGTIFSLVLGIVGALIFGIGMCCTTVWAEQFFGMGIIVGIIGLVMAGTAYPVYKKITAKQREKMAEQILAIGGISKRLPEFKDDSRVVDSADILEGKVISGKKVVIVGGALVGCETALFLGQALRDVTVVEMLDDYCHDAEDTSSRYNRYGSRKRAL